MPPRALNALVTNARSCSMELPVALDAVPVMSSMNSIEYGVPDAADEVPWDPLDPLEAVVGLEVFLDELLHPARAKAKIAEAATTEVGAALNARRRRLFDM